MKFIKPLNLDVYTPMPSYDPRIVLNTACVLNNDRCNDYNNLMSYLAVTLVDLFKFYWQYL